MTEQTEWTCALDVCLMVESTSTKGESCAMAEQIKLPLIGLAKRFGIVTVSRSGAGHRKRGLQNYGKFGNPGLALGRTHGPIPLRIVIIPDSTTGS